MYFDLVKTEIQLCFNVQKWQHEHSFQWYHCSGWFRPTEGILGLPSEVSSCQEPACSGADWDCVLHYCMIRFSKKKQYRQISPVTFSESILDVILYKLVFERLVHKRPCGFIYPASISATLKYDIRVMFVGKNAKINGSALGDLESNLK